MATGDLKEVEPTPLEKLREFLETEGMRSKTSPRSFADFERELHERMMEAERDIVAGEFDDAWALIAATFEVEVTVLANVIAFKPLPAPKKSRVKALHWFRCPDSTHPGSVGAQRSTAGKLKRGTGMVETSALEWLMRWCQTCTSRRGTEEHRSVAIDTLDNPGWSLKASVTDTLLAGRTQRTSNRLGTEDWTAFAVAQDRFEAFGGPRTLLELIGLLARLTCGEKIFRSEPEMSTLVNWYTQQCNGEWEHENGVRIVTLDDRHGWMLDIDLTDSTCASLATPRRVTERSRTDWVSIEIEDARFRARGGPANLTELMSSFCELIRYVA